MRSVRALSTVPDRVANCVTFAPQVALQTPYKRVGTSLPNIQALYILCLCAVRTPTATESEEGRSRLAVWTRPCEDRWALVGH